MPRLKSHHNHYPSAKETSNEKQFVIAFGIRQSRIAEISETAFAYEKLASSYLR
jgi:hypothetical protein